jgi:hypothetical protein
MKDKLGSRFGAKRVGVESDTAEMQVRLRPDFRSASDFFGLVRQRLFTGNGSNEAWLGQAVKAVRFC